MIKINKKAQFGSLMLAVGLIALLVIGSLVIAIGTGVLTFVFGEVTEVTNSLGMIDSTNMSEASEQTFGKVNDVVQMFKWGSGIAIIFAFLGIMILAATIRMNPSGYLIGFYVILMIVLVIISIFVSNIYEEFHGGGDEIATELQSMPLTSFLIIYFPQFITVIGFIGGIIIFSGMNEEFV